MPPLNLELNYFRCQGQSECSILVSKDLANSCPCSSQKYLDLKYTCVKPEDANEEIKSLSKRYLRNTIYRPERKHYNVSKYNENNYTNASSIYAANLYKYKKKRVSYDGSNGEYRNETYGNETNSYVKREGRRYSGEEHRLYGEEERRYGLDEEKRYGEGELRRHGKREKKR